MVKSATEMYKYSYACGQRKRRFWSVAIYFWGMAQVEPAIYMCMHLQCRNGSDFKTFKSDYNPKMH